MKKQLLILGAIILFASCSVEPKTKVADEQLTEFIDFPEKVFVKNYYAGNMHYKVFYRYNASVFVVNVTKDSLEVQRLLKK